MSTNAPVHDPIARALSRGRDGRPSKAWADVLSTVPLFESISHRHLRKIAGHATIKRFAPLTAIVRQGAAGDAFFVILDGTASVRRPGKRAVTLKAGDFFGEMSLLDGAARTATVEATSEVLTLRLGRTAFQKVLEQEPKVSLAMLRVLAARMRESSPTATD